MTSETPESAPARQRRRRHDPAFKQALVEQTLMPGASVARVAREHDINANQLFKWRRQFQLAQSAASQSEAQAPPPIALLPVTVVEEASAAVAVPGTIEIQLAGGTVRIEGSVDKTILQVVLRSLRLAKCDRGACRADPGPAVDAARGYRLAYPVAHLAAAISGLIFIA